MADGLGTSISYTSHLGDLTAGKVDDGRRAVVGMPKRKSYEADRGWDQLMQPYVKVTPAVVLRRQGGTSVEKAPEPGRRPVGDGESLPTVSEV